MVTQSLLPEELTALNRRFEPQPPQALLRWALKRFHPRIALASSFAAEDQVLAQMLWELQSDARVFTLDTGRLPPETYGVMAATEKQYGGRIEYYYPDSVDVETMVGSKGINLFYESFENRKLCCQVRKVEPLRRALAGLDAWITGVRREQNVTRAAFPLVELDHAHQPEGLLKLNPLVGWTEEAVWGYIRAHHIPYHPLYDRGYRSIGCAPCTRPVLPGENQRAGRWWWENPETKECGLHATPLNGGIRA